MHSDAVKNSEVLTEIKAIEVREYYDISMRQNESMYNRRHRNGIADNTGNYFELVNIDVQIFRRAFALLIKRHEILRTTFITVNDSLKQKITPANRFNFSIEELVISDEKEKYSFLKTTLTNAMSFPFDLEIGPLMKAILIDIGDNKYFFIFVLDHAICDGWAFHIMVSDQMRFYGNLMQGNESDTALEFQFKDYAAWQRSVFNSHKCATDIAYWSEKMETAEPINFDNFYTTFKKNKPSVKHTTFPKNGDLEATLVRAIGKQYSVVVPLQLKQKLISIASKSNSSLFGLLVASFVLVLYKLNGQSKTLLLAPFADRFVPGLEHIVGNMVGTIYVHNQLNDYLTLGELVQNVKFEILESSEHLINEHGALRLPYNFRGTTSLLVNFLDCTISGPRNYAIGKSTHLDAKPDCALECHIYEYKDEMLFKWVYNAELFTPEMIEMMADQHLNILHTLNNSNLGTGIQKILNSNS